MNRAVTIFLGLALAALSLPGASGAGTVAINEIVASNASGLADEDGDTEDWIELYNYGAEPVSLEDWGLSDDYDNPFRWVFPADVVIGPGEFLLVWASGKDRSDPESELHTNFRIASAGEEVLLTDPRGERIDEIPPTAIPTDISYGRRPDGTGDFFFFDEPTPGSSNATTPYEEMLDPPVFSHPGGFYTEEFELTLSHPDPEVTIVYTLDGSEPDIENLDGTYYMYRNSYRQRPGDPPGEDLYRPYRSFLYDTPIDIQDRSGKPDQITRISSTWHADPGYFPDSPVRKGTVLRAAAVRDGAIGSRPATHGFFVFSGGNPYQLPVISITTREPNLFDFHDGIYCAGVDFEDWRDQNPDINPGTGIGNYMRKDEHPAHLEFFETGASLPILNRGVGLRIHGGISRGYPLKSIRLYARNRYDDVDVMDYGFFPDGFSFNQDLNAEVFRRILFRHGGNLQDYISDHCAHRIMEPVYDGVQRGRNAVHFINGEFQGMIQIKDRLDQHHLANNFDLDPDNIVILNGVWGEGSDDHIDSGGPEDLPLYRDMYNFIVDNDMSDPEKFGLVEEMLDLLSYVDYNVMFIHLCNEDWYGYKHFRYWRVREPSGEGYGDGRWRIMVWDFDHIARVDPSTDYLATPLHPTGGGDLRPFGFSARTALLRNLLENPGFRNLFINRFADHINTTFLPARVEDIVRGEFDLIELHNDEHRHRWSRYAATAADAERLIDFAGRRPDYQRQHIRDHFGIDGQAEITLDVSNPSYGHIRVNTVEIKEGTPGVRDAPYPWTGVYFNGVPIELEAVPAPGYEFKSWEGLEEGAGSVVTVNPAGDLSVTAHFQRSYRVPAYYWFFDTSLPNDTPLLEISPTYSWGGDAVLSFHSALDGYPFSEGHDNWRKASMERRNSPTEINYLPEANSGVPYEETEMRGLQIRQPFAGDGGENTVVIHLPTEGFEEVAFRFAARDEAAAEGLSVDYSVTPGEPEWTSAGLVEDTFPLTEDYQLYELDFTGIPEAEDNTDFKIRLRFLVGDPAADQGGRVTFNNFSLEGRVDNLPPEVVEPVGLRKLIENGDEVQILLDEVFDDPDGDPLDYGASTGSEAVGISLAGNILTLTPQQRGGAEVNLTAGDGNHPPVETAFRVLVYPEAYSFGVGESDFEFAAWDPDRPEYSYPEHMLFLQSDRDDPGLAAPLLYPYHIEHDDYHADDQGTIGFPYNNTGRTRINGLGEDGISFINTGRGRDLGGALAALDTRGAGEVEISWLGGTLLRNQRDYAIRLQYRVGIDGPFLDLTADGEPVEYRSAGDGDVRTFEDIPLPPDARDKEYVQLLWRYHHFSGESGPRALLRLDGIKLSTPPPPPSVTPTPEGYRTPAPSPTPAPPAWFNPDWGYRVRITSRGDMVEATHPYGIVFDCGEKLAGPGFDGFWENVAADGGDIRVTAADGAGELARGIREFEASPRRGLIYFHASGLRPDADTDYYIYFGNPSAGDHPDPSGFGMSGAWGEGYRLASTMADLTSASIGDETVSAREGIKSGAGRPAETEGRIGRAQDFNGIDDLIDFGAAAWLNLTDNFSVSFWVKPSGGGGARGLLARNHGDDTGYGISLDENGRIRFPRWNSGARGDTVLPAGEWSHIVAVQHDGVNKLYVNATRQSRTGDQEIQGTAQPLILGRLYSANAGWQFPGLLDEIRVLDIPLGAGEIATIHNNQSDQAAFWEAGIPEEYSASPSPTATVTSTPVPTVTPTVTPVASPSPTATVTPPPTPPPTATATPSLTPPPTATPSITPSPPPPRWIHDYAGDGTSDIAVFRPGAGLWAVRGLTRVYFGFVGDTPVPGDYDGDGTSDIAVFRPGSGLWAVRGLTRVYFGTVGDVPLPGDYAGEGTAGFAVFRGSSGLWAVRGVTRVYFGTKGDLPAPGYYSGQGEKTIGIYRPGTGLWAVRGLTRVYFGSAGDVPIPGDYDGRARWAPAVFRPASGLWAVRGLTRVYFGAGNDQPVPGVYGGDGLDRMGVFRERTGLWAVLGVTRVYFGAGGDLPAAR